jgi:DNA primase
MTKDEIKQSMKMPEILSRYGLKPNRAGFIQCPFHNGDRTASMKIYKDSYYCFGCGATGDIFTFVQNMDNCDFKTAFSLLGGTYQKPNFSSRMAIYHHQKQMEMIQKEEQKKKAKLQECLSDIDFYRAILDKVKPLSDGWCEAWNKLQLVLYHHGFITELEEGD